MLKVLPKGLSILSTVSGGVISSLKYSTANDSTVCIRNIVRKEKKYIKILS